jgi:hypothetical protein
MSRFGYLSLLLPEDTGPEVVPVLIRRRVADALTASAETVADITVVTSKWMRDIGMRRWFVEYETGPPVAVVDPEARSA